jgi:phosphomannomutase
MLKTITKHITFGTSGHRGIIGEDFTTKHVAAIAQAVADWAKTQNKNPQIALGYDPRMGNSPTLEKDSFTKIICDILTNNGIKTHFFDYFVPTPVISWYIENQKLDGGLILTASHNPQVYNGLKFNPSNGAPAPSSVTKEIEEKANFYFDKIEIPNLKNNQVTSVNCDKIFAKTLIKNAAKYCKIEKSDLSNFSLVIDAKHGTVAKVWEELLTLLKIKKYEILNAEPLADFGKIEANPTKLTSLIDLKNSEQKLHSPLAVANDPDGDRHVILDEHGNFVSPEEIAVIILDYLVSKNNQVLGVSSTVASSDIIKSATSKLHLTYDETAVGFKNFAPFLEKARSENKIGLAVESSGGFSASFHTLEKCGFLPAVLLLFILNDTKKSLSTLKNEIVEKYGKFYFLEEEFHFPLEQKESLVALFKTSSLDNLQSQFKGPITSINKTDGLKIITSSGWLLMRLSGTEPLARIYAESKDKNICSDLIVSAKKILNNPNICT